MLKKVLWPILIGLGLAGILLSIFPNLRSGDLLSFENAFFLEEPLSYNKAVKRASPAVINIYSRGFQKGSNEFGLTPLGSGVIMRKNGYIATNLHVIEDADMIIVALQDGRTFTATLIGADKIVDIAVLKIEANDLPTIPINPSRNVKIGDVVLAIGNPYNIGQTITQGIISATGRDGLSLFRRQNFIQTDASINRGNSGGALVNTLGELVGINTLTFSKNQTLSPSEIPEGIGFAIPAPLVVKVMDTIIKDGEVIRGYIGIDGTEFAPVQNPNDHPIVLGILVTNAEGPAEEAGIQKNDILISVDNIPVKSIIETMNQIAELKPGSTIPIVVQRNGEKITKQVKIEQLKY